MFRVLYFFTLILLLLTADGCCSRADTNPDFPKQVKGWQEFKKNGIVAIGEFVLKKGESINNGKIGIELVEVIPGRECRGTESMLPRAVYRFFRLSDNETLLKIDCSPGSANLGGFNKSLAEDYGLGAIYTHEINTKNGWVLFELWK